MRGGRPAARLRACETCAWEGVAVRAPPPQAEVLVDYKHAKQAARTDIGPLPSYCERQTTVTCRAALGRRPCHARRALAADACPILPNALRPVLRFMHVADGGLTHRLVFPSSDRRARPREHLVADVAPDGRMLPRSRAWATQMDAPPPGPSLSELTERAPWFGQLLSGTFWR